MAETLESDPQLLAAFRSGDRSALATVYRRYVEDVARVVRRGVRVNVDGQTVRLGGGLAEAEVEVVVQDTFVRAFSPRARLAYDGLRPFGAWVTSIARNLLIDRARAAKKDFGNVSVDVVGEALGDEDTVDPREALEQQELDAVVDAVKQGWGPRENELFRLRFVDGLPQKEAAAALGVSVITVRRMDARMRTELLEALRAAGHLQNRHIGIPNPERDRSKG